MMPRLACFLSVVGVGTLCGAFSPSILRQSQLVGYYSTRGRHQQRSPSICQLASNAEDEEPCGNEAFDAFVKKIAKVNLDNLPTRAKILHWAKDLQLAIKEGREDELKCMDPTTGSMATVWLDDDFQLESVEIDRVRGSSEPELPDGMTILPGFSVGTGDVNFDDEDDDDMMDPWADFFADNGEDWGSEDDLVAMDDGPLENPGHTTFDTLLQQVLKIREINLTDAEKELKRQATIWGSKLRQRRGGDTTIIVMKDQYSNRQIKASLKDDVITQVMATPREAKFSVMDRMVNGLETLTANDLNAREFAEDLAKDIGMVTFPESDNVLVARDEATGGQVRIGFEENGSKQFMGFDWPKDVD